MKVKFILYPTLYPARKELSRAEKFYRRHCPLQGVGIYGLPEIPGRKRWEHVELLQQSVGNRKVETIESYTGQEWSFDRSICYHSMEKQHIQNIPPSSTGTICVCWNMPKWDGGVPQRW